MQPESQLHRPNYETLCCSLFRTVARFDIKMIQASKHSQRCARILCALAALLIATSGALAQSRPGGIDQNGNSPEEQTFAALEEEMRAKRAIRAAEKAHQENLERARSLSFIASGLATECKHKSQLDREDLKKLEKAEKLARSIRSAAGGSESEFEMDQPPATLNAALTKFAEVAASLKTKVEKTSKHVVSTAVIDEANVILELLRIARALPAGSHQ